MYCRVGNKYAGYVVIPLFCVLLSVFIQCSSFITKEQKGALKRYEGEYILLQEIERGETKILKNERVRIKIIPTDDYIKVYAMPVTIDIMKGEWILILYLFP